MKIRAFSKCVTAGRVAGWLAVWALAMGAAVPSQAARFVPNASGTEVTDGLTGLTWRRCAEGQKWVSGVCTGAPTLYTWAAALQRAKAFATTSGRAWRLANVKELQSLVNRELSTPALGYAEFPGAPSAWMWTSTPTAASPSVIWLVDFDAGLVHYDSSSSTYALRLVRSE